MMEVVDMFLEAVEEQEWPRTQKARGVAALARECLPVPRYAVVSSDTDIDDAVLLFQAFNYATIFARPCPTRPRHGFVESQVISLSDPVRARAQLAALLQAAQALDPDAELLVMPFLQAAYNVITAPGRVAVGPGHSGATAGSNAVEVPWVGYDPSDPLNGAIVRAVASAGISSAPYLEWIITPTCLRMMAAEAIPVQLRDGPAINAQRDAIPRRMRVKRVVVVEDVSSVNLIEWESFVASLDPSSDVVYLPGASLASHAAVHCVARGIAVMTSRKPLVGEIIEPTIAEEYDAHAFIDGLARGFAMPLSRSTQSATRATRFALYALHNTAVLRGSATAYLGVAAAILVRIGLALILGEFRHHPAGRQLLRGFGCGTVADPSDRDAIYESLLVSEDNFLHALSLSTLAMQVFLSGTWRDGYGGKAWYACARAWYRLARAVRLVIRHPSARTLGCVLAEMNRVVNVAHNNGWWMDKVISSSDFMDAAANHPRFAASAAVFAHELHEAFRHADVDRSFLARYAAALPRPMRTTLNVVAVYLSLIDDDMVDVTVELHDGTTRSAILRDLEVADELYSLMKENNVDSYRASFVQRGPEVRMTVGYREVFCLVTDTFAVAAPELNDEQEML